MSTCAVYVPPVVARTGTTPRVGAATVVPRGGRPVVALYGPMVSGIIQNPATTAEQGIQPLTQKTVKVRPRLRGPLNSYAPNYRLPVDVARVVSDTVTVVNYGPPEILYVSLAGPAILAENGTTRALMPGQALSVPANWGGNVWANAATSGHRFTAVVVQPVTAYPPTPYAGDFPPAGPTGLTKTIPAYPYQQYSDDDDIQALFAAYNLQTQAYVDWFNALRLPDYTAQSNALLDWVLTGLYDLPRPTLYSGRSRNLGPLNTARANQVRPDQFAIVRTYLDVAATSDDVYKRVAAWHLFRGDGRHVTPAWVRRRVSRFLYGRYNDVGDQSQISVVVAGRTIVITIVAGRRVVTRGALPNRCRMNTTRPNSVRTTVKSAAVPALAVIFKEAMDVGALEMPAQYQVVVRVGLVGAVGVGAASSGPGSSGSVTTLFLSDDVLGTNYLTSDDGSTYLIPG